MKLYDELGQVIECEILFTFKRNNKNFVVYFDLNTEDIIASFYEVRENNWYIYPITLEEDFDIVDEEIIKRSQNNNE